MPKVVAMRKRGSAARYTGKPIDLRLRCFVVRHNDRFYGECIDLLLATERPTLEDAWKSLDSMIDTYLQDVADLGCPRHLLYRRSGFLSRLEYYKAAFLRLLSRAPEIKIVVGHRQVPCPG